MNIASLLAIVFLILCVFAKGRVYTVLIATSIVFLLLSFLSQILDPGSLMSEEEIRNLPCKGIIAKGFEEGYSYYPEYNENCRSVIHVGHGSRDNGVDRINTGLGLRLRTKDIIEKYPQKIQYIYSCRGEGNTLNNVLKGKISLTIGEKEKEIVDDKEIYFFAKKGNLLLSLTGMVPWLSF